MNRDNWKDRRENRNVVGVEALKQTINDYEVKLCALHTENLSFQSELKAKSDEALKQTINDYEVKLCALHTENLRLQSELKAKSDEAWKATNEAKRNWDWFSKESDSHKATKNSIDEVIKTFNLPPLFRFLRFTKLDKIIKQIKN